MEVIKTCFLGFILFIAFIYQVALLVTLFLKRDQISLVSAIKRGDRLSKAGIFFFVLKIINTININKIINSKNKIVEVL